MLGVYFAIIQYGRRWKKKQKIFEFFSLTLEDFVVETAAIAC